MIEVVFAEGSHSKLAFVVKPPDPLPDGGDPVLAADLLFSILGRAGDAPTATVVPPAASMMPVGIARRRRHWRDQAPAARHDSQTGS